MAGGEPLLTDGGEPWQGWTKEEVDNSRRGKLKGLAFIAAIGLIYWLCSFLVQQVPEPLPAPSGFRLGVQCLLIASMWTQLGTEFWRYPHPTKEQDSFYVVGFAGKPGYLTFWILTLQTTNVCFVALAEASLFRDAPMASLLAMGYSLSIVIATIGVSLTLLFLKFCYFEEEWRRLEKGKWESRGIRLGFWSLLGHMLSLPVGIVDVIVKDQPYLKLCQPSFAANACTILAFVCAYTAWYHLMWAMSGYKIFPYPFLYEFGSCLKRMIFSLAILIFEVLLLVGVTLLV